MFNLIPNLSLQACVFLFADAGRDEELWREMLYF